MTAMAWRILGFVIGIGFILIGLATCTSMTSEGEWIVNEYGRWVRASTANPIGGAVAYILFFALGIGICFLTEKKAKSMRSSDNSSDGSYSSTADDIVAKAFGFKLQQKKCVDCYKYKTGCEDVPLRMNLRSQFGVCHRYTGR